MPGIRIHHPTLRSCVCIVPHPGDRRTNRRPKDYPITLDDDGNCIVSETVWRRLQEARKSQLSTHNFIVLNEVKDPPTIGIGWGTEKPDLLPTYREEHKRLKEINANLLDAARAFLTAREDGSISVMLATRERLEKAIAKAEGA